MTAGPTVLIMAAGEGTRMHSTLPKVLHPVCGRPMVAWPAIAAREAGAERVCVIVSPERDLSSGASRWNGDGRPAEAGWHRRRGQGGARRRSGLGNRGGVERRPPAGLGRRDRGARRRAPGRRGRGDGDERRARRRRPAGSDRPRLQRRHSTGSSRPSTRRAISGRDPRDPRGQHEHVRVRRRRAGRRARTGRRTTTPPGEYYIGDVLPLIREQRRAIRVDKVDDLSVNIGVNNRAELATVATAIARRPDPRAPHARRRDRHRPGHDLDRRRRRDRGRRRDRARDAPSAGAPASAARASSARTRR